MAIYTLYVTTVVNAMAAGCDDTWWIHPGGETKHQSEGSTLLCHQTSDGGTASSCDQGEPVKSLIN